LNFAVFKKVYWLSSCCDFVPHWMYKSRTLWRYR
jgi:hypothetical protein